MCVSVRNRVVVAPITVERLLLSFSRFNDSCNKSNSGDGALSKCFDRLPVDCVQFNRIDHRDAISSRLNPPSEHQTNYYRNNTFLGVDRQAHHT